MYVFWLIYHSVVIDWNILLTGCRFQLSATSSSTSDKRDRADEIPVNPDKLNADKENYRMLSFTLALQMLANGVEISRIYLADLERELALSLGFQLKGEKLSADKDYALIISGGEFNPAKESQKTLALLLFRNLKRIFDKYIVHFNMALTEEEAELFPSEEETSMATEVATAKQIAAWKALANRIFPSDTLRSASQLESDEKEDSTKRASSFFFFDMICQMMYSREIVQNLDAVTMKSWLDVFLIYIFKVSHKQCYCRTTSF